MNLSLEKFLQVQIKGSSLFVLVWSGLATGDVLIYHLIGNYSNSQNWFIMWVCRVWRVSDCQMISISFGPQIGVCLWSVCVIPLEKITIRPAHKRPPWDWRNVLHYYILLRYRKLHTSLDGLGVLAGRSPV